MDVAETLAALMKKAKGDPALREKLLATHGDANALTRFCEISTQAGFPIYAMDILEYGESSYAAMKRSTNGGGENSPLLDYEDDLYEMFIAELSEADAGKG